MATVDELVKQYETDKALQKEVADIVADGKITLMEFMHFAKKHNVKVSLSDGVHAFCQKTQRESLFGRAS